MDIPLDIWANIVQFLPDETIESLLGLNNFFYNLAMNLRYRVVVLGSLHLVGTQKTLERLQDDAVAHRVRSLQFQPHLEIQTDRVVRGSKDHPWRASLRRKFFPRFFPSPSPSSSPSIRETSVRETLMVILSKMVNLTEVTLILYDCPTEADIDPVLRVAWSTFGHSLTKLEIRAHVDAVRLVAMSEPVLPSLCQLELEFNDNPAKDSTNQDHNEEQGVLLNTIVPFINGFQDIQSLKVFSWSNVDFASTFAGLGQFPNLERLRLRAPFNRAFQRDPSGLTKFLANHCQQLTGLDLRLNPQRIMMQSAQDEPLGDWLSSLECEFTQLQDLQLYPTAFRPHALPIVLNFVRPSVRTLTVLAVKDRYLSVEEVTTIVDALAPLGSTHGLRILRLNLQIFSVDLLQLFAERLPELWSLRLFVTIVSSGVHGNSLENFLTELNRRPPYTSWKLYDLDIWRNGAELDINFMQRVARSIPSVKSFWGNGEMETEHSIDVHAGMATPSSPVPVMVWSRGRI